jgi:hypothetical protein
MDNGNMTGSTLNREFQSIGNEIGIYFNAADDDRRDLPTTRHLWSVADIRVMKNRHLYKMRDWESEDFKSIRFYLL